LPTKCVWSSCERSSSEIPFVSGINKVAKKPSNMNSAKTIRSTGDHANSEIIDSLSKMCPMKAPSPGAPPMSLSRLNPTWAMIAPSLPDAAEIPCAVDRYRVGKTSPGMMNVVVFGPKFWKKLARQYRKTKAFLPSLLAMSLSYPKPGQ
jgi:hypothetical protein